MAAASLVAFTAGTDESADQSVGSGDFHTLIPLFEQGAGSVLVELITSDGSYRPFKRLNSNPKDLDEWQIRGPVEYRVSVRNAGCDVDTGA